MFKLTKKNIELRFNDCKMSKNNIKKLRMDKKHCENKCHE